MKILLTTLHAKYSHASLALPCLAAYCRDIPGVSIVIREWTTNEPREQLLRHIMSEQADMVAFSCYIWNIEKTLRIASDIKKIVPDTRIALGGPEVSFNIFELMHDNPAIDFVIKGEGEQVFRLLTTTLIEHGGSNLLERSLAGIGNLYYRDGDDITSGPLNKNFADLDSIPSPFDAGLVDLKKPLVYYETSRGCPFSCAFCLSSAEGHVRSFGMERIKSDLGLLMRHNIANIKLVDRTFNFDAQRANDIWEFILEHRRDSHFHFEISADLLTEDNLNMLKRVPPNMFRFEIGVQSASETTLLRVGRKANLGRIFDAVRRLRSETGIELHLDLIAGLPGEDFTGFLASLRTVADLEPAMIQIEPLKVLKGSAMREIASRDDYHFSSFPPYTILRNPWLNFADISRIETIGRLLDLFYNHGSFSTALGLLRRTIDTASLFDRMARQAGNDNLSGLSTRRSYELFARLTGPLVDDATRRLLNDALFFDYCRQEMPLMGKLPSFAAERQDECAWPGPRELPDRLGLPADSRVKAFRCMFLKDYRREEWNNGAVSISFVYVSGAGRGLQVTVI
jgi:anaerobic magnesium-protoporphyrin IX monomethyl ester cyclase